MDRKNQGNDEAAGSDTFVFVSRDKALDCKDIRVATEGFGRLDAGEADPESVYFKMPASLANGACYLLVIADRRHEILESDDGNNLAWAAFDIV